MGDQLERLGVFQHQRCGNGRRQQRSRGRHAAIACGLARGMAQRGTAGRDLAGGHAPGGRCGADQHGAGAGTNPAQRFILQRCRHATARHLPAINGSIGEGLDNFDLLPIDIKLFGDQHRDRCLDALADFGIVRSDDDAVVGGDRHPGVHCTARRRVGGGTVQPYPEPAAGNGAGKQKAATVERNRHAFAACLMAARCADRWRSGRDCRSSPRRSGHDRER